MNPNEHETGCYEGSTHCDMHVTSRLKLGQRIGALPGGDLVLRLLEVRAGCRVMRNSRVCILLGCSQFPARLSGERHPRVTAITRCRLIEPVAVRRRRSQVPLGDSHTDSDRQQQGSHSAQ